MRKQDPIEPNIEPTDEHANDINILLAGILILATAIWLVALMTGKLAWARQSLAPYLPGWFLALNLLLLPFTCALAGLRSVPFRVGFIFFFVFAFQLSILGLSTEKYPIPKALVTILLYYETFSLIPGWNRRILAAERGGSVLGLGHHTVSSVNHRPGENTKSV